MLVRNRPRWLLFSLLVVLQCPLQATAVVMENLTAMKRAGADLIITYHALDAARWLRDG